jgi:hypothetical protein
MRSIDLLRASSLVCLAALLSACPKKDADAAPEPAAAAPAANDKAGAETPAPPPAEPAKKDDDKGGW